MTFHKNRFALISISLIIVLLDQFSKLLIVHYLPVGGEIRLFDGELIWIQHVLNPGMAFGIRFFPPIVLAIIKSIAIIAITLYVLTAPDLKIQHGVPLCMIAGGAGGNLVDRIRIGEVVDFISVDFPNFLMTRWPTFNVADSAVSVGVSILLLVTILESKAQREPVSPLNEE